MNSTDPFDLARFLQAQETQFDTALAELRRGAKRTHWMWFIFPQIAGLGSSPTARHYAIQSRDEAISYLNHPVLGPRLVQCAEALLTVDGKSASEIMGFPDDLKLHSSATLFAAVSPPDSVFHRLLEKYFSGHPDPKTLEILNGEKMGRDGIPPPSDDSLPQLEPRIHLPRIFFGIPGVPALQGQANEIAVKLRPGQNCSLMRHGYRNSAAWETCRVPSGKTRGNRIG